MTQYHFGIRMLLPKSIFTVVIHVTVKVEIPLETDI